MSVENKIRELLAQKLDENFPGMGKNKEDSAPMQGSSKKAEVQVLEKGSHAETATGVNKLAAGAGPKESGPAKQGSSKDATIDTKDDQATQGKTQAAKAKKQPEPTQHGAGAAPNFTTVADPRSVINQPNSKGNVHKEEVEEVEDVEMISEDEYNALSDEEKAEYELVETDIEETDIEETNEVLDEAMIAMKEELAKDVENLFASEVDLSEEFKAKAASLFEAVVTARVAHEVEKIEDVLAEQAANMVNEIHEELVGKVDAYLTYVAEQWLEQNEVAVEEGLRAEVTEDFIAGLKVLFKEHYIEIPEEKYDVLGEMQAQIDALTEKVNETIEANISLSSELSEAKRESIFTKATSDLAQTEAEKLRGLIEEVEFENEEIFEQKINVIKNNYFPKTTATSPISEEVTELNEVSSTVAKYAELLSRNTFGK